MRIALNHAVLVTVSLFLISVGAFVYPLMQDPFESQSMDVDAGNVTELAGGFRLEYDLPDSPHELASASLFVHSGNKTVAAHYLHDCERERLSSGEPFETVIVSGDLSIPYPYGVICSSEWSPDGSKMVFEFHPNYGNDDIYVIDVPAMGAR